MKDKKTKVIALSLTPSDIAFLDEYIKERNFISRSEAARHCIRRAYLKDFPEYLRPSPGTELKLKKLKEIQVMEKMTDDEFVETLSGVALLNQVVDGKTIKIILMNSFGNSLKAFPVVGIKAESYGEVFKRIYEFHKNELLRGVSVFDRLSTGSYQRELESDGIIIPETYKQSPVNDFVDDGPAESESKEPASEENNERGDQEDSGLSS